MMKRLIKTCLAAFLFSTAISNFAAAQELGPIGESSIDLSDFAGMESLPSNPLPGESSGLTLDIPDGPVLSSAGSSSRSPIPKKIPTPSTTVSKPPTSIDGATSAESIVDTGEVFYEGEVYEGEVYEGVVDEVHSVLGFSALGFRRNYGDDRLMSSNSTEQDDALTSGDADHRQIGGFEAYLIARSSTGVGWEFRYFGLAPSDNTATLGSGPTTALIGLNDIAVAPGEQTVSDVFAGGNFHSLTRETSIYNFEFNFLRSQPNIGWFNGIMRNTETMVGLRYFDFDESLRYSSSSDSGEGPRSVEFDSSVENSLFGLQTGGRTEFNIYQRLSGSFGLKLGAFYTQADANRRISGQFADGSAFSPSIQNGSTTSRGYDFGDGESDVSFLAELDLGLIYQLNQYSRLRLGYRRLGISGLAFASNNIPDDLVDVDQLNETDDSQSLRLRGIYFSYELAF